MARFSHTIADATRKVEAVQILLKDRDTLLATLARCTRDALKASSKKYEQESLQLVHRSTAGTLQPALVYFKNSPASVSLSEQLHAATKLQKATLSEQQAETEALAIQKQLAENLEGQSKPYVSPTVLTC